MALSFWSKAGGFMSDLFKKKAGNIINDWLASVNKPSAVYYTYKSGQKPIPVESCLTLDSEDMPYLQKEVEFIKANYLKPNYTNDDAAKAVLMWKTHRYPNWKYYQFDSITYGVEEYWAKPAEFFKRQKGDCDDFSLVEYHLLGLLGVPIVRRRCVAGQVRYQNGNDGGGHAYVIYFSERWNDWVVIETTWYDDVSLLEYDKGVLWKGHSRYGSAWFTFNEEGAYSSSQSVIVNRDYFKKV